MQYVVNLIQIIRIQICIYLVDHLYINTTPSIHPFIRSFNGLSVLSSHWVAPALKASSTWEKWLLIASVAPSVWEHNSHPAGPCSGLFLRVSMCHQHFRASRQIASEEHKEGAGGHRAREGSSLGRLFCAFIKKAHLVPDGGLFTGLTPASAKSLDCLEDWSADQWLSG